MTRIKICGVTRADDAARVAAIGVDFIGLNFWSRSKRYLAAAHAPAVATAARDAGAARLVGVFVNAPLADIVAVAVLLDVIQLHGDETLADARAIAAATGRPVWKAIAVGVAADVDQLAAWPADGDGRLDAVLLDAPSAGRGGAGQVFDWQLARAARERHTHRLVLAGGLGPHNVAAAITAVSPWAVDVASGVEAAPGVKDPDKVAAFVAAARGRG